MKLNPKQVGNVFWFGVYGIVQGNRVVGFCLNTPFYVTKKNVSTSNSIVIDFMFCATGSVKLELSAK